MNLNNFKESIVYVVSDSVGETAEFVVKAASSQFAGQALHVRKFPYIEDEGTLNEIVRAAKEADAIIAYTLVIPSLKAHIQQRAAQEKVTAVDIMSPMVNALENYLQVKPSNQPGSSASWMRIISAR